MKHKYIISLLILLVSFIVFCLVCQLDDQWGFIFPGGAERNNMRVCSEIYEKSYGGIFSHVGEGSSGKQVIFLQNGDFIPTYGILRHIGSLEKGDSIWKPMNTFDLFVISVIGGNEKTVLHAINSLPCRN